MMKAVYYVTLLLIILMMAFFAFNFFYDTFIDPYKKFKHSVVFLIATLILAVGYSSPCFRGAYTGMDAYCDAFYNSFSMAVSPIYMRWNFNFIFEMRTEKIHNPFFILLVLCRK